MSRFSLDLDFPEGVVQFQFTSNNAPRRVVDIITDILPLCDTIARLGTEIASGFGKVVSCTKGCGACCCQLVPVSPFEAALVADVIDSLPDERKNEILEKFANAQELIKKVGIQDSILHLYSNIIDKALVTEVNHRYFDLQIPCPFLLDGSCSIYQWRPSRCREFSVLSPVEYCKSPFTTPVTRLPVTIRLCESLSFAWASLTGRQPLVLPLICVPEWIRTNSDTREMAIEGSESFVRAVLEFACRKANEKAKE